ncbi:MAG: response regulator [Candidatus Melainabacteria bacterium]|nr:response regulator [Candidatus Melainabacteria bacterium]
MHPSSTTILLVEDNLPDAHYTMELLPSADYTFIPAVSLAQAVECLGSNNIDVVLLDLSLPDSHGLGTDQRQWFLPLGVRQICRLTVAECH